jgi:hypothetical protein
MILNTLNTKAAIESLSRLFDISEEHLETRLFLNAKLILNNYFSAGLTLHLNLEEVLGFDVSQRLGLLNEFVIHHLTQGRSMSEVEERDVLVLPYVLTKNTRLSEYLATKGFSFTYDAEKIIVRRFGKVVDVQPDGSTRRDNLDVRFGYNGETDYYINGYLIPYRIVEDKCKRWLTSSEILKSLAIFFKEDSIVNDFSGASNSYMVSAAVPFESIYAFDNSDNTSLKEKKEYFVKLVISMITHELYQQHYSLYERPEMCDVDYGNIEIQLLSDYCISKSKILAVRELRLSDDNNHIELIEKRSE